MTHDRTHPPPRHGRAAASGAELDCERLLTTLAETQEQLSGALARVTHLQDTLEAVTGNRVWRIARRLFDMIERRPGLHRLLRSLRRGSDALPLSPDAALLLASPFFDPVWYAARHPGLPREDIALASHCARQRGPGQPAPGPDFDPAWYIAQNPDAMAGNALLHYVKTGQYRLRAPTAAAERDAEASRRASLGLDIVVALPRVAVGLVGPGGGQVERAARSARIAAVEAGLGNDCVIFWAGDEATAPEGSRAITAAQGVGAAAAHNTLLREAADCGAALYLAVNARGIFDPGCLAALLRMSAAAGHGVLIAAQDFPQENPKAFDPITFDTGWAGGGCLLIPLTVAQALGGFDPTLDYWSQVDLSWRARQCGYGVKLCVPALFHTPHDRRNGARWIGSAELAEACRLASLWGDHDAAAAMHAQLRLHGGDVSGPGPDRYGRDPRFADFAHGDGLALARW